MIRWATNYISLMKCSQVFMKLCYQRHFFVEILSKKNFFFNWYCSFQSYFAKFFLEKYCFIAGTDKSVNNFFSSQLLQHRDLFTYCTFMIRYESLSNLYCSKILFGIESHLGSRILIISHSNIYFFNTHSIYSLFKFIFFVTKCF